MARPRFKRFNGRSPVKNYPCPGPRCNQQQTVYTPHSLCEKCYRALPHRYQKQMCATVPEARRQAFEEALQLLNAFGTDDRAFRSSAPPNVNS